MKNIWVPKKEYVITRKEICAGKLVKRENTSLKIYDVQGNVVSEEQLKEEGIMDLKVSCKKICRGMLFNVNENGLTNDLIYTTPTNYPIEGIEPKIVVIGNFMVENYIELEELLKYEKYGIDLTPKDVLQIYRKYIIDNAWLKNHQELFGLKKFCGEKTGEFMGYENGGTETIPRKIYDRLSSISCTKNGKPNSEEPGYSYIKKRR